MSVSCNALCCAIKKACRMLYPSEDWVIKTLDFILDEWADEDCPEYISFSEDTFLEEVFDGNDYEYATEQLSGFVHEIDLCIEQESDDYDKGSSGVFFSFFMFEHGLCTFRMPGKNFCGLTDFIGRPTVSMRRRGIEVRIEVYD